MNAGALETKAKSLGVALRGRFDAVHRLLFQVDVAAAQVGLVRREAAFSAK